MPQLHIEDPFGNGSTTVRGLKKDEPGQVGGAAQLRDFWVDPFTGDMVTRPPWWNLGAVSLVGNPGSEAAGQAVLDNVAFAGQIIGTTSNGPGFIYTSDPVNGVRVVNAVAPGLQANSVSYTASLNGTALLPYARSEVIGFSVYSLSRNGAGFFIVPFGPTGSPSSLDVVNQAGKAYTIAGIIDWCWAHGRLWIIAYDNNGATYMLWSNAGGTTFATASAGGGLQFISSTAATAGTSGQGFPRAIRKSTQGIMVVWDNVVQLYGATNTATPVSPNTDFTLQRTYENVGSALTGCTISIGDTVVIFTKNGMKQLSPDSSGGGFPVLKDALSGQTADRVARYYAQIMGVAASLGRYNMTGGPSSYQPSGAFMIYWAAASLFIICHPRVTQMLCISLYDPQNPKVFTWSSPQAAPIQFMGVVQADPSGAGTGAIATEMLVAAAWDGSIGAGQYPTFYGLKVPGTLTSLMTNFSYTPTQSAYAQTVPLRLGAPGRRKILKQLTSNIKYRVRNPPPSTPTLWVRMGWASASDQSETQGPQQTPTITGSSNAVVPPVESAWTTSEVLVTPLSRTVEEVRLSVTVPDIRATEVCVDTMEVDFTVGNRAMSSGE